MTFAKQIIYYHVQQIKSLTYFMLRVTMISKCYIPMSVRNLLVQRDVFKKHEMGLSSLVVEISAEVCTCLFSRSTINGYFTALLTRMLESEAIPWHLDADYTGDYRSAVASNT